MPTVAIYMSSFNSGGVQREHVLLAPKLIAAGWTLTFVVNRSGGVMTGEVPPEAEIVSLDAPRTLSALRPLARYLRRARPDVTIANLGHPNLIAIAANKLAGNATKVVASQHNHLSQQSASEKGWQHKTLPFLYRRFLRHADAIVACSIGVADDLAARSGEPRERITVAYNPSVPERLAELVAEPVDHPWFRAGETVPVAIALGRLNPQKDYPTMLAAIAKVPGVRLLVLGDGALLDELTARAAALGIADRVEFAGFRTNPYAYLARASVFVLASRYEGFGQVVAEALACGLPVVSTDCQSGPAEILADGRFGRLVPVGDADAMADAIDAAIRTPVDREALKARGELFSVARAADVYRSLIERVHATKGRLEVAPNNLVG